MMTTRKNQQNQSAGTADSVVTEVTETQKTEAVNPDIKPVPQKTETVLSRRAKLRAALDALPVVEPVEGDALDSYLIFDGTPIGDTKIPTFYMIHRSGRPSPNGDRPVYYLTNSDFKEFDFDQADFSAWAVEKGIPIVAGYVWSPDADRIEVRPWKHSATLGWEKIEKKIRNGLSKRDQRWLALRGLI